MTNWLLCLSSDMCDYAEEWCRSAYSQLMLLGQHHGWSVSFIFMLKPVLYSIDPVCVCMLACKSDHTP